jgi:DNA topoisomerase I
MMFQVVCWIIPTILLTTMLRTTAFRIVDCRQGARHHHRHNHPMRRWASASAAVTVPPTSKVAASAATKTSTLTTTTISTIVPPRRRHHLVIVESPAKCKTIESILNHPASDIQYTVMSCMGHVRDLSKLKRPTVHFPYSIAGIDLDSGDYTPDYIILENKRSVVQDLTKAAAKADAVILATDPDREGEAMAWHLQKILQETTKTKHCQRIRFAEITPQAITSAVPDTICMDLVQAQETRRVLDRLAGFTVSPLLWKCITPGLSAGRVQSVGLSLIVDRELERWKFVSAEYYDLSAALVVVPGDATQGSEEASWTVKLIDIDGRPVANKAMDFEGSDLTDSAKTASTIHLVTAEQAQAWTDALSETTTVWTVQSVRSRRRSRQPPVPYKTSTLQQDAATQLGVSVAITMKTAQALYEAGWISYMRTDSILLSDSAERATEQAVQVHFQMEPFSNNNSNKKKKNSKFAQEAHEAIRPAIQEDGSFLHPDTLSTTLSEYELKLYRMIYQRTVAYRMPPAIYNQTTIHINAKLANGTLATFSTSGSSVVDPGFTRAYSNPEDDTETEQTLPLVSEGDIVTCLRVEPVQHHTKPPPRYSEATFIKTLEALGIGRPSTYARIVQVLRDRAYVSSGSRQRQQKKLSGSAISAMRASGMTEGASSSSNSLIPSLTALCVCDMLRDHCPTYVDPTFTARMEEHLDRIAKGEGDRVTYLNEFYAGKTGLAAQIRRLEDTINPDETRKVRLLPNLQSDENISLNIGPWGPYVVEHDPNSKNNTKAPLPASLAGDLDQIDMATLKAVLSMKQEDGRILGMHQGRSIRLRSGRFGSYLQWGDDGVEGTTTHSLPKEMVLIAAASADNISNHSSIFDLTLDQAIGYVGLPRTICSLHDLPITAAIGPYGPYLKYNNSYVNLAPETGHVLTIDSESAIAVVTSEIIEKPNRLAQGVLAELGKKDGGKVQVRTGMFGNFLKWKKVNAKIPMEYADNPESISLEQAWAAIQEKASSVLAKPTNVANRARKVEPEPPGPPVPKRSKTAYLHFCAEKRPEVARSASSLGAISKELAALWAALSQPEREYYQKLAADDKRDREEKMIALQTPTTQQAEQLRSTNIVVEPKRNAPKRPKSAYLYFCEEMRPSVAEKVSSLGDISKELARLWALTADRSRFDSLADQDKQRYRDEQAFQSPKIHPENVTASAVNASKPKKTVSLEQTVTTEQNKPKQRAPSAYMLFCKEYRPIVAESGQKLTFGETVQRLASLWRDCDEEVKQRFQNLAAEKRIQMESPDPLT